ncbi:MAG: restriction endonuclease subunit S [Candidatus Cryptobacteroides sp.]|nr:restriction endonuclease subunit S [Candidatus Cryptobacteroides sp.]
MSREMVNSGIPWIGEIPKGWEIDTIGNLYTLRNEKVSDKDYPPLSVSKMGVVPQLETAAKTDDGDNRKLVKVGDFAINSRSDRRGSCGISAYDGSVSLINTVITPREQMNPRFYNWLFHSELFADEFYKWGHGIVDDLWTTRWQEMKRISIVAPSLEEQQKIASFLDGKCSEIDEMIALQEKIVEELKAYKQSVITEAVTKGLNPDAPMKDSGIEWIGEIPQKWICPKNKYYTRIGSGDGISNEELQDEGMYEVWGGGNSVMGYYHTYNIDEPRLIIGRVGACGYVKYSEGKRFISDNALIMRITSPSISYNYLYYVLVAAELSRLNTSTAQPLITATKVYNVNIPIPPLDEQQSIVNYLGIKCTEIDNLISIKLSKIDSLKEYKRSIIYEYVTGKKEVAE